MKWAEITITYCPNEMYSKDERIRRNGKPKDSTNRERTTLRMPYSSIEALNKQIEDFKAHYDADDNVEINMLDDPEEYFNNI